MTPLTATPERHDAPVPPFSLVPTTSLHSLSFMSCFAGSGSDVGSAATAAAAQSEQCHHSQHSLNNNKPSVAAPAAKSPMTGSKRPLSSSLGLDLGSTQDTEQSPTPSVHCSGNSARCPGDSTDVRMRSPEMRAKRPLVRPNSIAFSSYPLADFPGSVSDTAISSSSRRSDECIESSQTPVAAAHAPDQATAYAATTSSVQSYHQQSTAMTSSAATTSASTSTSSSTEAATAGTSVGVTRRQKPSASGSSGAMRPAGFEQARKSRSLENLLKPCGDAGTDAMAMAWTQSEESKTNAPPRVVDAAELFGQPMALQEVVKRQQRARVALRHGDMNQSSSSISSSGSHNSLHGSLEIIQVS